MICTIFYFTSLYFVFLYLYFVSFIVYFIFWREIYANENEFWETETETEIETEIETETETETQNYLTHLYYISCLYSNSSIDSTIDNDIIMIYVCKWRIY